MYFSIEDDDLLEKYNTIWNKVSADVKKNLIENLSIIKSAGGDLIFKLLRSRGRIWISC